MQIEPIRFRDVGCSHNHIIDHVNPSGMTNNFFMIFQWFAGNGQPFFNDKHRLAQRQRIALQRRTAMCPQIPKLGNQCGTDVVIQSVQKT